MKNIFNFLILILLIFKVKSQNNESNIQIIKYNNDTLLQTIFSKKCSTGCIFLQEQSELNNDTLNVNSIFFRDILYSLQRNSFFQDSNHILLKLNIDTFFIKAHNFYQTTGNIPIGILAIKYNVLNDSININSLSDIYNFMNLNNFYKERILLILAPLIDVNNNANIKFSLDSNFVIKNINTPTTIIIKDSINEFNLNILNKTCNFVYTNAIKYSLHYANFISSTNNVLSNKTFIFKISIQSTNDYEFIVGGLQGDPWDLVGKATIRYGCNNFSNQIRKPFIFVEGFDPGTNAGEMNNFGRLNWAIFSDWQTNNNNSDVDHDGIIDYSNLKKAKLLVDKLTSEGFDVIYLEFKNSTRDIRQNARVLLTLLYYIEQNKITKSGIVLSGGSMGGLVAKYSLKLAKDLLNSGYFSYLPNIKAFITFDSPHQDANIPLGDQYFIDFFSQGFGQSPDAIWAKISLNSTASQEMIRFHIIQNRPIKASFYADYIYANISWIKKRIAISNGSNRGQNGFQGFYPGSKLLEMVSSCTSGLISGRGIGKVWAVPDNSNQFITIFEGHKQICINFSDIESEIIKGINLSSIDNSPGGIRYTNKSLVFPGGPVYYPHHSFIPTLSAFHIDEGQLWVFGYSANDDFNYDLRNNLFLNPFYNYVPNPNVAYLKNFPFTPFNILYSPDNNQQHVEITDDNINFLMNEISPFDLYLQNETYTSNDADVFEARNTITAGKNVTNKTAIGDFIVDNTADITFRAGDKITLKDGFHAKAGSKFKAYIDPFPCPPVQRLANPDANSNSKNSDLLISESSYPTASSTTSHQSINNLKPISIIPNPTEHSIQITLSDKSSTIHHITIKDISGKIVLQQQTAPANLATLNVSDLANGIYFVTVETTNSVFTEKLIIQK